MSRDELTRKEWAPYDAATARRCSTVDASTEPEIRPGSNEHGKRWHGYLSQGFLGGYMSERFEDDEVGHG